MKVINRPAYRFITRWFVCSLGLSLTALILSNSISYHKDVSVVLIAGLILAIINTVLKPFLIVFSLPALIFSLGLFMIVINGITVYITSKVYTPLHINNFWAATFAGMVIGLVNYLVTTLLEDFNSK
jgi:putative membrane protein